MEFTSVPGSFLATSFAARPLSNALPRRGAKHTLPAAPTFAAALNEVDLLRITMQHLHSMDLKECSVALRHLAMFASKRSMPTHRVAIASRPETLLLLQHTQRKLQERGNTKGAYGPAAQLLWSLGVLRHLTHPCAAEAAGTLLAAAGDVKLPAKTLLPLAQTLASFVATAHRTDVPVHASVLQLLVRLQQPLCQALETDANGVALRYAPTLIVRWLSLLQAVSDEDSAVKLLVPDADSVVSACLTRVSEGVAAGVVTCDMLRPSLDRLQSLRSTDLTPTEQHAWSTILGWFEMLLCASGPHPPAPPSTKLLATLNHRASQMATLAQAAGPSAAVSAGNIQRFVAGTLAASLHPAKGVKGGPVSAMTPAATGNFVTQTGALVESDWLGLGHPTLDTSGGMAVLAEALSPPPSAAAGLPAWLGHADLRHTEGLASVVQAWSPPAQQLAAWRTLAAAVAASPSSALNKPVDALRTARGLVQLLVAVRPEGEHAAELCDELGAHTADALTTTAALLLQACRGVGKAVRLSSLPLCADLATAGLMLHAASDALASGLGDRAAAAQRASSVGAAVGLFGLSAAREALECNPVGHALSTPAETVARLCILQAAGGVTGEDAWLPLLRTLVLRCPLLPDTALVRALAAPSLAPQHSTQTRLMAQAARRQLRQWRGGQGVSSNAETLLAGAGGAPLVGDWGTLWGAWPALPPPPAGHSNDADLLRIVPRGVPLSSAGGLMVREGGLPRPTVPAVEAAQGVLSAIAPRLREAQPLQPMLTDALHYTQERLSAARSAVGEGAYSAEAPSGPPQKWFVPPPVLARSFAQHELALLQRELQGSAAAGGACVDISHHRAVAGMATRLTVDEVSPGRMQPGVEHVELRVDALRKLAVFGM